MIDILGKLTEKALNYNQIGFIKNFDSKSKVLLRNIGQIFIIKCFSVACNILVFSISLKLISKSDYGIFLTVSSFIGWFSLLDIGIGNGLRNKLTLAITNNDYKLAKILVSSAYFIIGLIFSSFFIIFFIVSFFINWSQVFSTEKEVYWIVISIAASFSIRMILQTIQTIYYSYQKSSRVEFLNFISQFFMLICFYLLPYFFVPTILNVSLIFSFAPILIFILFNAYDFTNKFKEIIPSYKDLNYNEFKGVMTLGFNFFFIQIAVVILFSLNNFMINKYFNPEYVTDYNIAYKYYGITLMILSIMLSPLWSMMTKASAQNDYAWIKRIYFNSIKIWFLMFIFLILLFFVSPEVYKIWIGKNTKVDYAINLSTFFYFVIFTWNSIIATFLNGLNKIKLQLYLSMIGIVIYCLLVSILPVYVGASGIILSTCFSLLLSAIILTIQILKILDKKDTGLWSS